MAAATLMLAAVPASAQAVGWLDPAQVSEQGVNSLAVRVAATPQGDVAFGYSRAVPATNTRVALRLRLAGGALGSEQLVSDAGTTASALELAAGSNGTIVAAWTQIGVIGIARRLPGAPPGSRRSPRTRFRPGSPDLHGTAAVLWPAERASSSSKPSQAGPRRSGFARSDGPADSAASAIAGALPGGALDQAAQPPIGNAVFFLTRPVVDPDGRTYAAWRLLVGDTMTDTQYARASIPPAAESSERRSRSARRRVARQWGVASACRRSAPVPVRRSRARPERRCAAHGAISRAHRRHGRARQHERPDARVSIGDAAGSGRRRHAARRLEQSSVLFSAPQHVRGFVRPLGTPFPAASVIADPGAAVTLGDLAVGPTRCDAHLAARGLQLASVGRGVVRPPGGNFGAPRSPAPIDSPAAPPAAASRSRRPAADRRDVGGEPGDPPVPGALLRPGRRAAAHR